MTIAMPDNADLPAAAAPPQTPFHLLGVTHARYARWRPITGALVLAVGVSVIVPAFDALGTWVTASGIQVPARR